MSDSCALLLTDLVDSTRLVAQLGDANAASLWQAHDRAARDLLRHWRGREIDRTDGLLLVFDDAADAAGYALAYHRALAALPGAPKARVGLHVGSLVQYENPPADVALGAKRVQVEGLALPTTARIMALAQGGQTLLSGFARAALPERLDHVACHGHWKLKGLDQPIELFELGERDAPFTPPADSVKAYRVVRKDDLWLPRAGVPHNLPAERNAFIGREATLRELGRRLESGARVVSVLGIGGMGKTRLAQRFGWTRLGDFAGGVWHCDLSPARGQDGVVHAVAQGLEVPLGKGDSVEQIGGALAGRGECLVILDNFEQVAALAERTLGRWLDRAPNARFIVTTREVLGIVGEEVLTLEPLSPDEGAALFSRRAADAQSGFQPTAEDAAAIDPLVRLLDGLPLAIELACGRVRVMPPRVLLARMSERFRLLASRGGRIDRQATLRAALDWSWDLLSPAEKSALAQLSVFEGGYTLAAAEQVLDAARPEVMDLVQAMVDKSWVRRLANDRFDLLISVKEYAADHLRESGRFAGSGPLALDAAIARHCRYFAGLDARAATAQRCVEIENLVAACRRATSRGDARSAAGALANAWHAIKLCGPFRVALDLADAVREIPRIEARERGVADWVAGSALHLLGDKAKSRQRFDSALSSSREAADRHAEVRLLYAIGDQLASDGRLAEARPMLDDAHARACALDDASLQCVTLNGLGALCHEGGQMAEAERHYRAALALARELADPHWQGGLLGNLGSVNFAQGRFEEARDFYEQALIQADLAGDRRWEGNMRCNLGLVYHELGRARDARPEFEKALAIARNLGHTRLQATVLCNLGIVAESLGARDEARQFHENAVRLACELSDRRLEGQFRGFLGLVLARSSIHGEARDCLATGEALLQEVGDLLSLCHLLCQGAEASSLSGDRAQAAAMLLRAERLAAENAISQDSEVGRALERARRLVG